MSLRLKCKNRSQSAKSFILNNQKIQIKANLIVFGSVKALF